MISSISPLLGLFVVYKASTNVHIKLQSKRRGNSLLIGKISNLTTEKETHKMQDRVSSSENHSFESYDETMLLSMSKDCPDHIIKCGLTADWNEFHLVSKSAADLSSNDKNLIYQLFEDNMKTWYLKNWGLNVIEKKKELYNPNSRFICVYKSATLTNTPSTESSVPEIKSSTDVSSENELVAFAMFRFEWDDEDEPEHPVLFCYEIQICDTYRGQKIGRKLMDMLTKISEHWSMWKVLLTCFKNNIPAMEFYHKIGFGIDANSPSSFGHNNEVYEMLSNKPKSAIKIPK